MILLAGWWLLLTPLKNDGVSWDDFPFPIWWESHKIHVPNHQLGPKMSPVVSCCRSSGSLHVVFFEAKNSLNVNLSIWSNWQPPGLIWRHWTLFSILPGWCWNTSGWQSREDHLGLGRWNSPAALEKKLFRCDRCWRVQTVQFLIFSDILCLWPFFGILCRTLSEKMKRKMRIQHMSPCFFVFLCTGHFMQKVMTDSIYIDIYILYACTGNKLFINYTISF